MGATFSAHSNPPPTSTPNIHIHSEEAIPIGPNRSSKANMSGPRPSDIDAGYEYYDAEVRGGNMYGDTAQLYISKGNSSSVAFEGTVVGGDPCQCSTMASQCGCVFGNREKVQMKIANRSTSIPGIFIDSKDMEGRELARQIVKAFNDKHFVTKKAYVHAGVLLKITKNLTDQRGKQQLNLVVGEHILVDKNLFDSEKFNSKEGWSSGAHGFSDFLSHWSWFNSNGDHLLCDLQGHRGVPGSARINGSDNYYMFTDPVVISRNEGTYGFSDLGQRGMDNWLANHECNKFCKHFDLGSFSKHTTYKPLIGPY